MTQFLEMTSYSSNQNKNNKSKKEKFDIENQLGREQEYKPRNPYTSYSKTEAIDRPLGFEQRVGNNTINEDDLNNIRWREIDGKKYPPLRKTPTDLKYAKEDKNTMMRANLEDGPIGFGGKKTRKKRSKKRSNKSLKRRRKKSYKKRGKK